MVLVIAQRVPGGPAASSKLEMSGAAGGRLRAPHCAQLMSTQGMPGFSPACWVRWEVSIKFNHRL